MLAPGQGKKKNLPEIWEFHGLYSVPAPEASPLPSQEGRRSNSSGAVGTILHGERLAKMALMLHSGHSPGLLEGSQSENQTQAEAWEVLKTFQALLCCWGM